MQVKVFSRDESRSRNFLGTLQQGTGETDLFIDLDFDQQDKNDDDSIHSRGASRLPQSYGSVEGVSTADVNGHERQFRTSIAPMA